MGPTRDTPGFGAVARRRHPVVGAQPLVAPRLVLDRHVTPSLAIGVKSE